MIKFPDCVDCINQHEDRICDECDDGEFFEPKDEYDLLDFDDDSVEDFPDDA